MNPKAQFRPQYKEDRISGFVNKSGEPRPLMEFLVEKIPAAKRTDIKKWLKYGQVMVGNAVTTAFDAPVGPEVEVKVNFTRGFPHFSHPRVQLVYEDDHIIVINKGYGLLSVRTNPFRREECAYDIVRDYVRDGKPYNKLYIVHRLDRDTSGLMMFTKTEEAQQVLRHNWNNMILERLYVAVLEGNLEQDKGYVKSRLTENSQFIVYSTDEPGVGKLAITHYEVVERGHGYTLALFSLDTGRKNQIRVHASEMGHPIAGDHKYGASSSPIYRLCLHAMTLRFAHPITRRDMHFSTPMPPDFIKAVRRGR